MKKISLVLVLTILCSLFSFFVPASAATTLGAEEMNLLICLGAKAETELDSVITVGGFAKLLAASIYNPEDYIVGNVDEISDEELTKYAIYALNKYGMLEDGVDPAATLDFDTTIKALVNMLGFGQVAQTVGYKTQAAELGILKGVYPANENAVTTGEAVAMIYNSLFINILEMSYLTNNRMEYDQSIDETILTKNRNMYRYKGFLYDNGITAVNGPTAVYENEVKIGDYVMSVGKTNVADYLAYYVEVFYLDKADEKEIICFKVTSKNNNVVYLESSMIEESSNLTEVHYEIDGELDSVRISPKASYIYNGAWQLALPGNNIVPESGDLTLFDIDFDNVYDIVMVNNCRNVVVKNAVPTNYMIIGMFEGLDATDAEGDPILYNDTFNFREKYEEEDIHVYKDGVKVPFSTISAYDVLAIYESDSMVKIEICTQVANGEIKTSNVKKITTTDDQEFGLTPEYASLTAENRAQMGSFGTLYLSKNGDVIFFEGGKGETTVVAYLHKMYYDESEEQAYMRVFTEKNEWAKLDVAEKLYVNDIKLLEKDINPEYQKFYNADGTTARQLISYTTNVDGEIKRIYTSHEEDGENTPIVPTPEGTYFVDGATGIDPSFKLDGNSSSMCDFYADNTKYFIVPQDPADEEMYEVSSSTIFSTTSGEMESGITGYYITDESEKMAVIDYLVQFKSAASYSFSAAAMVMEVGEVLDANEELQQYIKVFYRGAERTYYSNKGQVFNGLEMGDMVYLSYAGQLVQDYKKAFSAKSELTSADVVNGGLTDELLVQFYGLDSIDELNNAKNFLSAAKAYNTEYYRTDMMYGTVTYKDGNYFTFKHNGNSYKLRLQENAVEYYRTRIYVYDEATKTVRDGGSSDIYPSSKLYVDLTGGYPTTVVVINRK